MKNTILIYALLAGISAHAELKAPTLYFSYSYLYDSICGQAPGRTVDEAWSQETDEKTSQFESWWLAEEPALTGKLFEIYGKGFKRKELTATLSACPGSSSTSDPLVLVVNRYLKTYMPKFPAETQGFKFADQVFHELLHNWLEENLVRPTPLLEKYKDEAQIVKNHLHLMAMQKEVYLSLKRDDLLNWLEIQYSRGSDPGYRRAWDIVNRLEGFQAFSAEVKNSK